MLYIIGKQYGSKHIILIFSLYIPVPVQQFYVTPDDQAVPPTAIQKPVAKEEEGIVGDIQIY
jgi:hypothetical protein